MNIPAINPPGVNVAAGGVPPPSPPNPSAAALPANPPAAAAGVPLVGPAAPQPRPIAPPQPGPLPSGDTTATGSPIPPPPPVAAPPNPPTGTNTPAGTAAQPIAPNNQPPRDPGPAILSNVILNIPATPLGVPPPAVNPMCKSLFEEPADACLVPFTPRNSNPAPGPFARIQGQMPAPVHIPGVNIPSGQTASVVPGAAPAAVPVRPNTVQLNFPLPLMNPLVMGGIRPPLPIPPAPQRPEPHLVPLLPRFQPSVPFPQPQVQPVVPIPPCPAAQPPALLHNPQPQQVTEMPTVPLVPGSCPPPASNSTPIVAPLFAKEPVIPPLPVIIPGKVPTWVPPAIAMPTIPPTLVAAPIQPIFFGPQMPSVFIVVAFIAFLYVIAEVDTWSKRAGKVTTRYAGVGGGSMLQMMIVLVMIGAGVGLLFALSYLPTSISKIDSRTFAPKPIPLSLQPRPPIPTPMPSISPPVPLPSAFSSSVGNPWVNPPKAPLPMSQQPFSMFSPICSINPPNVNPPAVPAQFPQVPPIPPMVPAGMPMQFPQPQQVLVNTAFPEPIKLEDPNKPGPFARAPGAPPPFVAFPWAA